MRTHTVPVRAIKASSWSLLHETPHPRWIRNARLAVICTASSLYIYAGRAPPAVVLARDPGGHDARHPDCACDRRRQGLRRVRRARFRAQNRRPFRRRSTQTAQRTLRKRPYTPQGGARLTGATRTRAQ
eukprot:5769424-Pleurochrysis_carterae.AAC.4